MPIEHIPDRGDSKCKGPEAHRQARLQQKGSPKRDQDVGGEGGRDPIICMRSLESKQLKGEV